MENFEQPTTEEQVKTIEFTNEIRHYLLNTARWGKFLAIIGYVTMGLLIVMGIFMVFSNVTMYEDYGFGPEFGLFGIIYFVIALIYFIPVTYLYRFSNRIKHGLFLKDQARITSSFANLKSLFRFTGIMTIVLLVIYVVGILMAVSMSLIAFNGLL